MARGDPVSRSPPLPPENRGSSYPVLVLGKIQKRYEMLTKKVGCHPVSKS